MTRPDPSAHRGAPLPSALGAWRRRPQPPLRPVTPAPAGPRSAAAASLPTVEEVSAGGVIVREHDGGLEVAVIARYNRGGRLEWCLPKGHPEGEEDHRQAAVREVEEETGLTAADYRVGAGWTLAQAGGRLDGVAGALASQRDFAPLDGCMRTDLLGASVVIWTTTPWTIPQNRAVAFNPHAFDSAAYF